MESNRILTARRSLLDPNGILQRRPRERRGTTADDPHRPDRHHGTVRRLSALLSRACRLIYISGRGDEYSHILLARRRRHATATLRTFASAVAALLIDLLHVRRTVGNPTLTGPQRDARAEWAVVAVACSAAVAVSCCLLRVIRSRGLYISSVYIDPYANINAERARHGNPLAPVGRPRVGGICAVVASISIIIVSLASIQHYCTRAMRCNMDAHPQGRRPLLILINHAHAYTRIIRIVYIERRHPPIDVESPSWPLCIYMRCPLTAPAGPLLVHRRRLR